MRLIYLIPFLLLVSTIELDAQRSVKLDDQIKSIRDDSGLFSCDLPGWSLRFVFNRLSDEHDEEMIVLDQLLRYTKRLRMVIADNSANRTEDGLEAIYRTLRKSKNYDQLLSADNNESKISLWTETKGDRIKEIFLSMMHHTEKTVLVKIKSDMPLESLDKLPFVKNARK